MRLDLSLGVTIPTIVRVSTQNLNLSTMRSLLLVSILSQAAILLLLDSRHLTTSTQRRDSILYEPTLWGLVKLFPKRKEIWLGWRIGVNSNIVVTVGHVPNQITPNVIRDGNSDGANRRLDMANSERVRPKRVMPIIDNAKSPFLCVSPRTAIRKREQGVSSRMRFTEMELFEVVLKTGQNG